MLLLPAYCLRLHQPPPAKPATLTLTAQGCVYLSKILVIRLGLRPGQAIDLLLPTADRPGWQLDLRPTAGRVVDWYVDTRARIQCVSLPAGLLAPQTKLTLVLGDATPQDPNLYPLDPMPAPSPLSH